MVWAKGQKLQDGKYVIEDVLGIGGCGITYLASTQNGELVAIKTPHQTTQSSSKSENLLQDFLAEAKQLQKFRHPHIVRFYDVFQEESLWCIVMEYVAGETLAVRVGNRGVMPESEALPYIHQIGDALSEVHKDNVLHRDVNPRNIILRSDSSEAVLIDFGIAREFNPDQTQTHTLGFSDGYAPIEQYRKRHRRGAYTDVYGLTATLYFLLAGEAPISAFDRDDEIRKDQKDPLVPPKQINDKISNPVNEAILKGMAFEPSDRPQSMHDWLLLLQVPLSPEVVTPSQINPVCKREDVSPPSSSNAAIENFILDEVFGPTSSWNKVSETSSNVPIFPWCDVLGLSIANLIFYPVIGWLLSIYSAPIWIWTITVIGFLLVIIYYIGSDLRFVKSPNDMSNISNFSLNLMFWLLSVILVWVVYSVWVTTVVSFGMIAGIIAEIVALLIVFIFFVATVSSIGCFSTREEKHIRKSAHLVVLGTLYLGLAFGWSSYTGYLSKALSGLFGN